MHEQEAVTMQYGDLDHGHGGVELEQCLHDATVLEDGESEEGGGGGRRGRDRGGAWQSCGLW
jgi:hypothetical protein